MVPVLLCMGNDINLEVPIATWNEHPVFDLSEGGVGDTHAG